MSFIYNNLAIKYVSECNNPDTLKKWYGEITNEEVRLAITKKFQKLEIELPEDEIPDTPNESPMTLDEFDSEDEDEDLAEDSDENLDSESEDEDEDQEDNKVDYSEMTVAELKEICEERGIDTKKLTKKADFLNALAEE